MDIELSFKRFVQDVYDILQHFHSTSQLPAVITGVVIGLLLALVITKVRGRFDKTYSLLREQITDQQSRLDAAIIERDEALRSRDDSYRRIGEITGEKNGYREQRNEFQRLLDESHRTIDVMKNRIEETQRINDELRHSLDNFNRQLDDITNTDGQVWTVPAKGQVAPFRHPNERQCPIISVVNFKGGVGKTHITGNVGASIASTGKRVLLVDLDHQGSLTQLALTAEEDEEVVRTERFIDAVLKEPSVELLKRCIVSVASAPGLHLLSARQSLSDVENQLMFRWNSGGTPDDIRYRLRSLLHDPELVKDFDLILIDCPPRLTTGCINALAASDHILVPVLLEAGTTETVPRMLQWLRRLQGTSCPDLTLLGIVGNKAFPRTKLIAREERIWLDLQERSSQFWGQQVHMFESIIREQQSEVQGRFSSLDNRNPHQGRYQDLVEQLYQELPHYARRRPTVLA